MTAWWLAGRTWRRYCAIGELRPAQGGSASGQECDLGHTSLDLAVTSGRSRTVTDTYGQLLVPRAHALAFASGSEGLQSGKHASAEPADGGGLAAQVTGSTYGATGRHYLAPALPTGHRPMGDPPSQLIFQASASSLCGHLFPCPHAA
jgi:hypothetical protein